MPRARAMRGSMLSSPPKERSHRGLVRALGKRVYLHRYRGFESLPLRHRKVLSYKQTHTAQTKEIKPIDFFNSAIKRSESFISGGRGNKGRRDADDLRAAVVFAVASIDAFFRAKTIYVLRKKRQTNTNSFILSESARKAVQKKIAMKLFNREYAQLDTQKKRRLTYYASQRNPA